MGNDGQDEGKRWDRSWAEAATRIFPPWACTLGECPVELGVSADHGLSSEEVATWLHLYGPNELERHALLSVWKLVLEQFDDMLVRILLLAAVVSFVLMLYDGAEGSSVGCDCPRSGGDGFGSVNEELAEVDGQIGDILHSLQNRFQKLDKIKDASHRSNQLEELTDKMRDCKRLIKDFEQVSKGEAGRTDLKTTNNAT